MLPGGRSRAKLCLLIWCSESKPYRPPKGKAGRRLPRDRRHRNPKEGNGPGSDEQALKKVAHRDRPHKSHPAHMLSLLVLHVQHRQNALDLDSKVQQHTHTPLDLGMETAHNTLPLLKRLEVVARPGWRRRTTNCGSVCKRNYSNLAAWRVDKHVHIRSKSVMRSLLASLRSIRAASRAERYQHSNLAFEQGSQPQGHGMISSLPTLLPSSPSLDHPGQ